MMEAAPPAGPAARIPRPAPGTVAAAALHLLLLATLVQAWLAGWPGRVWLAAAALAAVALSAALRRRARGAPPWVGGAAVAWLFLFPLARYGSGGGGLRIAGLPFGAAASVLVLAALAAAAWQAARLPRLPHAVRLAPAGLALYAGAGLALGVLRDAPLGTTLAGGGRLPFWLHGPYLGAGVLLPAGVALGAWAVAAGLVRRRRVARPVAVLALLAVAFLVTGVELTRQGRPNLAMALLPASLAAPAEASAGEPAAGPGSAPAAGLPDPAPGLAAALSPGEEWLAAFEGGTLDETFARVAGGVRFEPYRGILRGPVGTAVAQSGNSADQALLLAEVLRRAGYRVRLARGTLEDGNAAALVRGMYPPRVRSWALGPEYAPYDPAADAGLRETVRSHLWVEVFQGTGWLPLDPSFPRARIGEAYAAAEEHFEEPAPELFQRLAVVLKEETGDGAVRDLGRFEGTVAELGLRPISLVVRAIPQEAAGEPAAAKGSPGGLLGGMGGALGGGEDGPEEPARRARPAEIVAVAHRRELEVAGERRSVEATVVRNGDARGAIRREWLEFTLTAPGEAPRVVERDLFRAGMPAPAPAEARRYTIGLVPGRVPHAFVDAQMRRAAGAVDLGALGKRLRTLSRVGPDAPEAAGAARELARVDDAAGALAGHLLTLRFAAESDSLARLVADGNGVALSWATPRILIAGVETRREKRGRMDARVSLDLRLDEVRAYPYPGAPARLAAVFHAARGVQESVLEGALVARASGRDAAAHTARLVAQAEAEGVPLLVIGPATRDALDRLDRPSPACRARIEHALARGREVVVPTRAIQLAGAPRWGWWEVDPASGDVIGVMEDGEHQGMVEYSASLEKIGLNDKTGRAIGVIVGATTTQINLATLLLEHGRITPELVATLRGYVEQTMCTSCFGGAEAKVEAGGAVGVEHDCFEVSAGRSVEAGASGSISFCDEYYKGFKCAAGLILRGLEGEGLATLSRSAGLDAGFSGSVNCEDL